MRMFYIKISGAYLHKTTEGFEYCLDLAESEGVLYAHKFTDKEYDSIKPLLPADHTLELVVDEKPSFKWVKMLLIAISLISAFVVLVIGCQTIWVLTDAIYPARFKIAIVCCVIFIVTKGVLWITNR